ncbi:MAG: type IV secretion system protein [Synergistaceae bacterium]|jgi:P-type conjugative transfer protein TrbL|nr:type IV secretion system protein [Synergistaceae bacterium]
METNISRHRLLKELLPLLLLTILAAALYAPAAYAAVPTVGSAPIDNFITAAQWTNSAMTDVYSAALRLFWAVAVIQFAWAMIQLALRGSWTMAHITSLAVKEIMFIGFFYWLLLQADPSSSNSLMNAISRGMRYLGMGGTSGSPPPINPAKFFFNCVEILHNITNSAFQLGVYNAVWAVVPYALTLVSLSFAAAFAVIYVLEFYVVLPAGIILLGLGGTTWTRRFATNYVRVLISVGLKLLCLQVILGVASTFVDPSNLNYAASIFMEANRTRLASEGFFQHAFMFAGFSAIIFMSIKTIPQFAANLVNGAWFDRANWHEPASFPPLAMAGAGIQGGQTPQTGHGAADVQSVTGTVSAQDTSGVAGMRPGEIGSSLSSGATTAAQEHSNFQGAGFGNYAHDIVFESGAPDARPAHGMPDAMSRGGMPDALARGGMSDAAARGGTSDAMARGGTSDAAARGGISDAMARGGTSDAAARGGISDAMARGGTSDAAARGGMSDAMARGGTSDAMAQGGMSDAMARGGMSDAMARGGTSDAAARGGMSDAMARGGMPDARASGGMPDARASGGMPDARASGGMSDARPAGGMSDARPADGMPDARASGGMPDARSAGGMPAAAPPPTSSDMRQTMRDSMNSGN